MALPRVIRIISAQPSIIGGSLSCAYTDLLQFVVNILHNVASRLLAASLSQENALACQLLQHLEVQ